MTINWTVVATIAAPIIALFVGSWLTRWYESRPVLISYYGHLSTFNFTPPGGNPVHINTHTVVLRNASRLPVTGLRLHHHGAVPLFSIWPQMSYTVEPLPAGSQDIVIPTLVPGKEVHIAYLYSPPVTYNQINAGIDCEQGIARPIPVLLQRQYPRWLNRIWAGLMLIGLISVVYLVYRALVAAMT
jgi:hypothetical protein